MAAVKSGIPVKVVNGHPSSYGTVRAKYDKYDNVSSSELDSRRQTVSSPAQHQYASLTLGRKPIRSGSFSFQKSKDVPNISVTPAKHLFLRDHNRCSTRSLDIDYDSQTLATPPRPIRRQKRVTTPSHIPVPQRSIDTKKIKEKLSRKPSPIFTSSSFLSPAQSLTNLSYPSSPSTGRKSPTKKPLPSPVYNLSIAPSIHNVSVFRIFKSNFGIYFHICLGNASWISLSLVMTFFYLFLPPKNALHLLYQCWVIR